MREACLLGQRDPVLLAIIDLFGSGLEDTDLAGDEDLRFEVELLLELLLRTLG